MKLLDNGICTPEQLDLVVKASLMPRGMVLGLVQRPNKRPKALRKNLRVTQSLLRVFRDFLV